jgi:hypothetical protein
MKNKKLKLHIQFCQNTEKGFATESTEKCKNFAFENKFTESLISQFILKILILKKLQAETE